ncbi:DNA-processing protein DprA [Halanaerobacter jeridensis]|uniref:DNA processing protein n=1 Tax=Halanaerobacter jeridensis TaxID=706427 RepID=A0A938XT25_9FIRM|nr:DNA-processing protein DprA [Halanaerobacter jeridensis]MBM7556354.1 DNA processing protein [Halanaerobacter jeridensis]
MLYTQKDYMKFALIVSDYEQKKYPQSKLSLHLLTTIFQHSLRQEINIFSCSKQQRENIITTAFDHNQYYESRVKKAKQVFLNQEYLNKLTSQVETELELCQKNNINFLEYESKDYPAPLQEIATPPVVLFYQGQLPSDAALQQSLAVVGSRDCEQYGQNIAHSAGRILSEHGWWNISGLAAGCDTNGHWGSLEANGLTGAVLAHGLAADIYPPENKDLAAEIISSGGFLLSEVAPSTSTAPHFFKWRDRLQSGLTKGIFVVETGRTGGTLHTTNYALRQGKQVYVWEPTTPSILPEEKIEGNLMLVGLKEPNDNFKIKSQQRLDKINSLSCPRELIDEFERLQQEELTFQF